METKPEKKSDRTRWRFDSVRNDVHSRVGHRNREAVERAVPLDADRSFCSDAAQAVELLLVASRAWPLAKAFLEQLKPSELEDVDFVLKTKSLKQIRDPRKTVKLAAKLWAEYAARSAYGICPRAVVEKRNREAESLWKNFSEGLEMDSKKEAWNKVEFCVDECPYIAQELAIGPLLRFLESDYLADPKNAPPPVEEKNEDQQQSQLWKLLQHLRRRAPKTAEEWLGILVSFADGYPLCCVVSDMATPGAPMAYINSEFCRITGFSHDETVGRNCRFLQGRKTQCEAVEILRDTLRDRMGSHVLMTNYRKSMEPFRNLLTMSPVFDGNGDYRFVVAVQFEVESHIRISPATARRRLVRLGRFLNQLPLHLPYPSMTETSKFVLRGAWADEEGGNKLARARMFLERRGSTLDPDYDGPGTCLRRYTNLWITRASWLAQPATTAKNFLKALTARTSSDCSSLLRNFFSLNTKTISIPQHDLVMKFAAVISAIDLVLEADAHLSAQSFGSINDDAIGLLALLCGPYRAYNLTANVEHQRRVQREISFTRNAPPTADAWADNLFGGDSSTTPQQQKKPPVRRHQSDLADGLSTPSSKQKEVHRPLVAAKLGMMLRDQTKRLVVVDELKLLRNGLVDAIAALIVEPLATTDASIHLIEYLQQNHEAVQLHKIRKNEETTTPQQEQQSGCGGGNVDDEKLAVRPALAYSTAVRRSMKRDDRDYVWGDFLPALGHAVGSEMGFVAADMRAPGLPLIYVNEGFTKMTKYASHEAIGKNCAFLQVGKKQEDVSQEYLVEELAANLRAYRESVTKMICFDKDGAPFQVLVVLVPIFDANQPQVANACVYTVGLQIKLVSEKPHDYGRDLVHADACLHRLPRTTTCQNDGPRLGDRPSAPWASAPLDVAVWLAMDDPENFGPEYRPRCVALMTALLKTPTHRAAVVAVAKKRCSVIALGLLTFVLEIDTVSAVADFQQRRKEMRKLLIRMPRNYLFYYSPLEIILGQMDRSVDFEACLSFVKVWRDHLFPYLAAMVAPRVVGPVLSRLRRQSAEKLRSSKGSNDNEPHNSDDDDDDDDDEEDPPVTKLSEENPGDENDDDDSYAAVASKLLLRKPTNGEFGGVMEGAPVPLAMCLSDGEGFVAVTAGNRSLRKFLERAGIHDLATKLPVEVIDAVREGRATSTMILHDDRFGKKQKEGPCLVVVQPLERYKAAIGICGADNLALKQELGALARVLAVLSGSKSGDPSLRDVAYSSSKHTTTAGCAETEMSNSVLAMSRPDNKPSKAPSLRTKVAVKRYTAAGAESPALLENMLTRESRDAWHAMDYQGKVKRVNDAIAKLRPSTTKTALLSSTHDKNEKTLAREESTAALDSKIRRLEAQCEEVRRTLSETEDQKRKDVADVETRRKWEADNLKRTQALEVDELQCRQVAEVQSFVDRLAEIRSVCTIASPGAQWARGKRRSCTCLHPYLCTHNKNSLTVVVSDVSADEQRQCKAAETLIAQQDKFRYALLQRHQAALDAVQLKYDNHAKVLESRYQSHITKYEARLDKVRKDLSKRYDQADDLARSTILHSSRTSRAHKSSRGHQGRSPPQSPDPVSDLSANIFNRPF